MEPATHWGEAGRAARYHSWWTVSSLSRYVPRPVLSVGVPVVAAAKRVGTIAVGEAMTVAVAHDGVMLFGGDEAAAEFGEIDLGVARVGLKGVDAGFAEPEPKPGEVEAAAAVAAPALVAFAAAHPGIAGHARAASSSLTCAGEPTPDTDQAGDPPPFLQRSVAPSLVEYHLVRTPGESIARHGVGLA